ncbi:SurA N-terminal domain-containing protein [Pedobacter sp. UC225_65]|uniref:SurA N-terminal domain-containing protein n=1 Tax=Pedobacter sp. UC225_65 TaxID=3350173 RepID=UPI0036735E61
MGYFLVGGIAVVLALFVLEPLLQQGSAIFGASRNVVGSIDGQDIKYDEFSPKVEQSIAQFKQQYGGNINPQMQAMAVDQAWQAEIANTILTKEYSRLGLTVSGDELFDLLQGKNPSPLIVQYFGNPQTGQVDRAAVISSLKAQAKDQS